MTILSDNCGAEAQVGEVTASVPPVSMQHAGEQSPGSVAAEVKGRDIGRPLPFLWPSEYYIERTYVASSQAGIGYGNLKKIEQLLGSDVYEFDKHLRSHFICPKRIQK